MVKTRVVSSWCNCCVFFYFILQGCSSYLLVFFPFVFGIIGGNKDTKETVHCKNPIIVTAF